MAQAARASGERRGRSTAPRRASLPEPGGAEDEYFADGVTDAVRGKLTAIPGLQVTASNSSTEYKGTVKSAEQIGQELGVDYLLVGKVRWEKSGGASRVRVSPELIQVSTSDGEVAGAVRRRGNRRVPGADRHRGPGGPGAGRRAWHGERQALAARPTAESPRVRCVSSRVRRSRPGSVPSIPSPFAGQPPTTSRLSHSTRRSPSPGRSSRGRARLSRASAARRVEPVRLAHAAAERALALAPEGAAGHLAMGDYYASQLDNEHAIPEYAAGRRLAPNDAELLSSAALSEQSLGHWTEALEHLQQASRIDPRSVLTVRRLARAYQFVRRYPEAREAGERALQIAPTSLDVIETHAMTFLAQGDLEGARAVLTAAEARVEPTTLVAFISTFWDLYWPLTDEQQALLRRLTPGPFDDNRAGWGLALAEAYALHGDQGRARAYADSSAIAFQDLLRSAPDNGQNRVLLGVALAYQGKKNEAVREGERGLAQAPLSQDAYGGAYNQLQLARIYIMVGEQEKALDQLEPLLKVPYYSEPWVAQDRSDVRSDPEESAIPEARGGNVMSCLRRVARCPGRPLHPRARARPRRHGHSLPRHRR